MVKYLPGKATRKYTVTPTWLNMEIQLNICLGKAMRKYTVALDKIDE